MSELRVELEQNVGGRPIHFVGYATTDGDRAVLRLTQGSEAGGVAVELLREELVDPVYWGLEADASAQAVTAQDPAGPRRRAGRFRTTPRASGEDASTLTHGRASDHLRPEASTTIL